MMPAEFTPHRRGLLRLGCLGALGLDQLLWHRAHAADAVPARADHAILIFLNGGPSHLDMWDLKPHAPEEIRGPFKPIASSVPGLQLSEHLPRLAKQMHRACLIRSMHHSVNNSHAAAVYCGLTGHDRGEAGGGARPTDQPAMGAITSLVRPPKSLVPGYVSLPYVTQEGLGGPPQPGFSGGLLGKERDPLYVLRDPNENGFRLAEFEPAPGIDNPRLRDRQGLITRLESVATEITPLRERAFRLLDSDACRDAFSINRESERLRDAYGRNIYGQSTLLARRLIEAGTRLVCLSWAPHANATWDTHGQNFNSLKTTLLPQLDAAASTLIDDLAQRGLLDRTVVMVGGEFGRTPKVNANAGRDHWNFCYSTLVAGGGFRAGHVHGASDRIGAQPSQAPLTPADLMATVYQALGVNPQRELRDRLERPFQVCPWGQIVPELLA
ncbi:MAG: DUF1501 domain-containing protein [Planctomycetota bacterium]|jgi:hypothetical protein